jgi:DNA-binding NarL/FixJ family response regulator
LGQRGVARAALTAALDLANRCGAQPVAQGALAELVASGARPRRTAVSGVDSLTPSERRVCELAVTGSSNRHIAQALFLTVKTVETHLSNSYGKLGISSKGELPEIMASTASDAA